MKIYKHYNQQQLNDQYNNRLHVPGFAGYFERWEKQSAATREKHSFVKDLPYGVHPRECLDIFQSGKPDSKTLVFIHGGYWQMFDKKTFHFIADTFLSHQITTVVINYPLAPGAPMDEMVASCRKAITWLQQNLVAFNANPEQLYVAGHSAGAHLAAMLLKNKWPKENQNPVKGICAISGLFDLRPIQLSYVNDVLQMDQEMAVRNSPINLMPAQTCATLVATGNVETTEFKDQSRNLYQDWKNKGVDIEMMELPGLNHFSILDTLADENTLLHKAFMELMEK